MNTAHTPQALSLPHLQIAEVSARRRDEDHAFEEAAARLRPAWMRGERHEPAPVPSPARTLHKALRQNAVARSDAEADQYRRRLLGDLQRSQRSVRHLFIAGFVAVCGVLALADSGAPVKAHRAEPAPAAERAAPAASAPAPQPASEPAAPQPAVEPAPPAPAQTTVAPAQPARLQPAVRPVIKPAIKPAIKPGPARAGMVARPGWKARVAGAPAARSPAQGAPLKRPAFAPKRAPAQPVRAPLQPAAR